MPCTISPAESTQRMAWSGGEGGDVWESPRWRDNYVAFTTSHSTKTQVHRSEEWRTRVHMIRASTDLRIPHQSMKQSQCIQSPRVEDFVYHLHDCRIFTKLDLRQDYHQLAVDMSTRQVVTFSTPWGNYRPQKLARCLQWSQVHEQSTETYPTAWTREMTYILGGRDETEHREVLKTLLQWARDCRITFNREKCQFGMEQIKFFTHILTKAGQNHHFT